MYKSLCTPSSINSLVELYYITSAHRTLTLWDILNGSSTNSNWYNRFCYIYLSIFSGIFTISSNVLFWNFTLACYHKRQLSLKPKVTLNRDTKNRTIKILASHITSCLFWYLPLHLYSSLLCSLVTVTFVFKDRHPFCNMLLWNIYWMSGLKCRILEALQPIHVFITITEILLWSMTFHLL